MARLTPVALAVLLLGCAGDKDSTDDTDDTDVSWFDGLGALQSFTPASGCFTVDGLLPARSTGAAAPLTYDRDASRPSPGLPLSDETLPQLVPGEGLDVVVGVGE